MDKFARFRRLRENRQRWLNNLTFLMSCKRHKVIPNFIKIKCNVSSTFRVRKALKRMHFIILRTVIKDTRSKLAFVESQLYNLHIAIANNVQPVLWNYLDSNTFEQVSLQSEQTVRRHHKKLDNLMSGGSGESMIPLTDKQNLLLKNPKVVNLSEVKLDISQTKVLNLGLNFSIKSGHSDNIDVVANVEKAFKYSKIRGEQKDFLRHKLAMVLDCNNKGSSNLSTDELGVLKGLRNRSDIIITRADKGGALVVLSAGQYKEGIETLLRGSEYSASKKSVLENLMCDVKKAVRESPLFNEVKRRALIPTYYQPGRMYVSPKIHKDQLCFRPIISSINTPTYLLAKFMVKKLSLISRLNPFTVGNSYELVDMLRNLDCSNKVMMSFDVTSMFTCIPVQGALCALFNRLSKLCYSENECNAILKIVEICTRPALFSVNNKIYQQDYGLPMGGSLSPILCDLYMWELEDKIERLGCNPVLWKRYVDDVFTLFHVKQVEVFGIDGILQLLNSLDINVKFTVEIENDNMLPFLDIEVFKNSCIDKFVTSVYRKPFSVATPPHNRSAHPYSQKMSAFHFYVYRAFRICSNQELLECELNFLKYIAVDRGYIPDVIEDLARKINIKLNHPCRESTLMNINVDSNKPMIILPQGNPAVCRIMTICNRFFKCISKPSLKISNFVFPPKDVPLNTDRPGVYFIPCQCGMGYVGQTCRSLRFRVTEHKSSVKLCKLNSNVAMHAWEKGHAFQFKDVKLIKFTTDWAKLNVYEAANIIRNKNSLVNDQHYPYVSNIWLPIIQQMSPLSPSDSEELPI